MRSRRPGQTAERATWIRFAVWLLAGLFICFVCGRTHSRLRSGEVGNPEAELS